MRLAYWMYSGPAHVGTLRVASSMSNVHAIMHAPIGDDYFNVMSSMLGRQRHFTPVTATIVDRDVLARGSQDKVVDNIIRKDREERPDLIIVTPTCTSSILQEDLQNYVERARFETQCEVIVADTNHYQFDENESADRVLRQVIQHYLKDLEELYGHTKDDLYPVRGTPKVNVFGVEALGFHHSADMLELHRLLRAIGVEVNLVIPDNLSVDKIQNILSGDANICLYRETGLSSVKYLKEKFGMLYTKTPPIGLDNILAFLLELEGCLDMEGAFQPYYHRTVRSMSEAAWFVRSIDCQNCLGKKAVIHGDATHAIGMADILTSMGVEISSISTYSTAAPAWFREQAAFYTENNTDIYTDYREVVKQIDRTRPDAIFGTQLERHVGKNLGIPSAVCSAPSHIQDYPMAYSPLIGFEGLNNLVDRVYNTFALGMEDHFVSMFSGHDEDIESLVDDETPKKLETDPLPANWSIEAREYSLTIPSFVRKKATSHASAFAKACNIDLITPDVIQAARGWKEGTSCPIEFYNDPPE